MQNVIDDNKWSNWMEYDKISNTPIFSKMTHEQILERMKQNSCKLHEGKSSWKIYGLVLNKKEISDNIKNCPNTMKILSKCPDIKFAS